MGDMVSLWHILQMPFFDELLGCKRHGLHLGPKIKSKPCLLPWNIETMMKIIYIYIYILCIYINNNNIYIYIDTLCIYLLLCEMFCYLLYFMIVCETIFLLFSLCISGWFSDHISDDPFCYKIIWSSFSWNDANKFCVKVKTELPFSFLFLQL